MWTCSSTVSGSRSPSRFSSLTVRRITTSPARVALPVCFTISSGGVRGDAYHSQDSEDSGKETQFDPIWNARARVDSLGWTAEIGYPAWRSNSPPRHTKLTGVSTT